MVLPFEKRQVNNSIIRHYVEGFKEKARHATDFVRIIISDFRESVNARSIFKIFV